MNGLMAALGSGPCPHRFGGTSWKVVTPAGATPRPTLLLAIDLRDPNVQHVLSTEERAYADHELPVVTRSDLMGDRQTYEYDPMRRSVVFVGGPWSPACEPALPPELAERSISLRPVGPQDLREGSDDLFDAFLGGPAWLRVGGEPLWRTDPEAVTCTCGVPMLPLVWIGHESLRAWRASGTARFLDDEPFFLGELALYFFVCLRCRRVTVVTQG
jgi:hypothetical protein